MAAVLSRSPSTAASIPMAIADAFLPYPYPRPSAVSQVKPTVPHSDSAVSGVPVVAARGGDQQPEFCGHCCCREGRAAGNVIVYANICNIQVMAGRWLVAGADGHDVRARGPGGSTAGDGPQGTGGMSWKGA
jgi:hypothetical protein